MNKLQKRRKPFPGVLQKKKNEASGSQERTRIGKELQICGQKEKRGIDSENML